MLRTFIVLLLLMPSQLVMAYSYTLEIAEPELQHRVAAMMPIQKQVLFFSVLIYEPKLDLIKSSNKIGVATNIEVVAPDGSKGSGRISLSGTLQYISNSGEFYFNNPVIESIKITNIPEQFTPDIKQMAQLILTNAMATHPIYTLQDNDLRQKHLKSVLESIVIENEKLLVTLSAD